MSVADLKASYESCKNDVNTCGNYVESLAMAKARGGSAARLLLEESRKNEVFNRRRVEAAPEKEVLPVPTRLLLEEERTERWVADAVTRLPPELKDAVSAIQAGDYLNIEVSEDANQELVYGMAFHFSLLGNSLALLADADSAPSGLGVLFHHLMRRHASLFLTKEIARLQARRSLAPTKCIAWIIQKRLGQPSTMTDAEVAEYSCIDGLALDDGKKKVLYGELERRIPAMFADRTTPVEEFEYLLDRLLAVFPYQPEKEYNVSPLFGARDYLLSLLGISGTLRDILVKEEIEADTIKDVLNTYGNGGNKRRALARALELGRLKNAPAAQLVLQELATPMEVEG